MIIQGLSILLLISFPKSSGSAVIETIERRSDCYEFRRMISLNSSAISRGNSPDCLFGGLWKNYQCNISSCYCVYVDTGSPYHGCSFTSSINRKSWNDCCGIKMEVERDGCQVPFLSYPCDDEVIRYVYNAVSQKCDPRIGCSGFLSQENCQRSCVLGTSSHPALINCTLRKNVGRKCSKPLKKYFWYNRGTHQCESFTYKGCGGNLNRFSTLESCKKTCVGQRKLDGLVVMNGSTKYNLTLPERIVEKYMLQINQTNNVSRMIFQDIARNVLSAEILPSETTELNTEGIVRGIFPDYVICRQKPTRLVTCRASFSKWYFDFSKGRCVLFEYGGCHSNGNNFSSEEECIQFCSAFHVSSVQRLQ